MPPQRAILTKNPPASRRFGMQFPEEEIRDLEMTTLRLQQRRERGDSKLTKQPTQSKLVRLALRQLFANTTEQLEELLETTEL